MQATKFMRQPFFVSGFKVTNENMVDLAKWCSGHIIDGPDRIFIRVPVERATNVKQTEAYIGTWILVSNQQGKRTFKVYTEEWLRKHFLEIPNDDVEYLMPAELTPSFITPAGIASK